CDAGLAGSAGRIDRGSRPLYTGAGSTDGSSVLDEADVARARALDGFLGRELDALTFAQQFEHRAAHGAAMEEVLHAALVANEPEPLVDQEPCNCAGRHTRVLR